MLDERRVPLLAPARTTRRGNTAASVSVVPVHDHDRGVDLDIGVDNDRERFDREGVVHLGEEVGLVVGDAEPSIVSPP